VDDGRTTEMKYKQSVCCITIVVFLLAYTVYKVYDDNYCDDVVIPVKCDGG